MKRYTLQLPVLLAGLAVGLGGLAVSPKAANATCSPNMYMSSICWTGGDSCPKGFVRAAGGTLTITKNPALYSILGTTFGGDGRTTFGLPDLRGRVAVGSGKGPGLAAVSLGQMIGTERTQLTTANLPPHSHSVDQELSYTSDIPASKDDGDLAGASEAYPANRPLIGPPPKRRRIYSALSPDTTHMASDIADITATPSTLTTEETGYGSPITLRPPQVGFTACIATTGKYLSRN